MDIVIPYRNSNTDELRYCLRSLKNIEHDNVFIIGDRPDFISDSVIFIENKEHGKNAQHDNELNIRLALNDSRLSDDFILFNDDFFVIKKVKELIDYNAGDIDDVLAKRDCLMFRRHNQGLINTKMFIGLKGAVSFELHIPMIMNKQKRLDISNQIIGILPKRLLLPRTIYGNAFCDIKNITKDVKLYVSSDKIPSGVFVSTLDSAFNGIAGDIIKSRFRYKCKYEI